MAKENTKKDKVIDRIKKLCTEHNLKCNTSEYENKNSFLNFTCKEDHTFKDKWSSVKKRSKIPKNICMECSGHQRVPTYEESYEKFRNELEKYDMKMITNLDNFKGMKHISEIQCAEGHNDNITFDQFQQRREKNKCSICKTGIQKLYGESQIFHRKVFDYIEEHKLELISAIPRIQSDPIEYKCPKGHINIKAFKKLPMIPCTECSLDTRCPFIRKKIISCYHIDTRKKRECDITVEWAEEQLLKQGGLCYYSGIKLNRLIKSPFALSIDRLDNSLGHLKSNCVVTTSMVNYGKNSKNHNQFIEWLKLVKYHMSNEDGFDELILEDDYDEYKKILSRKFKDINKKKREKVKRLITKDDLIKFIIENDSRCCITGIRLTWASSKDWNYGSLDRIDNDGNYTSDNIQLMLFPLNMMKHEFTIKDLRTTFNDLIKNL